MFPGGTAEKNVDRFAPTPLLILRASRFLHKSTYGREEKQLQVWGGGDNADVLFENLKAVSRSLSISLEKKMSSTLETASLIST